MGFVVIPAVDMRGGKAVRLSEGDFARETRYFDDPVEAARRWVQMGARRLHLVDLDAAKGGSPVHREVIEQIARTLPVPVEVGGGIRTMESVEGYLTAGVQWVVVGTAAVEDRDFVLSASRPLPRPDHPGYRRPGRPGQDEGVARRGRGIGRGARPFLRRNGGRGRHLHRYRPGRGGNGNRHGGDAPDGARGRDTGDRLRRVSGTSRTSRRPPGYTRTG